MDAPAWTVALHFDKRGDITDAITRDNNFVTIGSGFSEFWYPNFPILPIGLADHPATV